jgi:TfoX/Sxy family transcriptional regulator of competence genes
MSNVRYNAEVKAVIDSFMLEMAGVVEGKMFGYPAYYINKKLIACIYEDGVGLKVPESLASELRQQEGITYFQPMGRRKMKEWIQINRYDPDKFLQDIDIFKESVSYVASLAKKQSS